VIIGPLYTLSRSPPIHVSRAAWIEWRQRLRRRTDQPIIPVRQQSTQCCNFILYWCPRHKILCWKY
jgi:hypothetical protein